MKSAHLPLVVTRPYVAALREKTLLLGTKPKTVPAAPETVKTEEKSEGNGSLKKETDSTTNTTENTAGNVKKDEPDSGVKMEVVGEEAASNTASTASTASAAGALSDAASSSSTATGEKKIEANGGTVMDTSAAADSSAVAVEAAALKEVPSDVNPLWVLQRQLRAAMIQHHIATITAPLSTSNSSNNIGNGSINNNNSSNNINSNAPNPTGVITSSGAAATSTAATATATATPTATTSTDTIHPPIAMGPSNFLAPLLPYRQFHRNRKQSKRDLRLWDREERRRKLELEDKRKKKALEYHKALMSHREDFFRFHKFKKFGKSC
jgi:hypothetical protein